MRYRSSPFRAKGRRNESKGRAVDCSKRIEVEVGRFGDRDCNTGDKSDDSFEAELLLLRMKDPDSVEFGDGVGNLLDMPCEFFYQQDEDGDTQLHNSIMMNHSEAAKWLIELAAEPWLLDIANYDSQTALHVAVLCRRPEIVRRLVLAGADLELRTRQGNTALHLACLGGDIECAKAILRPVDHPDDELLSGCNNNSRTSFVSDDSNEPRIDLELKNYVGKTCLHIAASRNDADLVDLLLQSGANPCSREGLSGFTALHMAVQNDCPEVARLLIKANRSSCLERADYAGCTAHRLALELNRRELIKELQLGSRQTSNSKSQQQCLKLDNKEDLLSMQVAAFARMSFG